MDDYVGLERSLDLFGSLNQLYFRLHPMGNPLLFFGTIGAFGAHLAAIYLPALQWVFRMEPISLMEWLRIGLISITVVIVVEIDKLVRRVVASARA